MQNILIVQTCSSIANKLSQNLQEMGCNIVDCVYDTKKAIDILGNSEKIDLILLDNSFSSHFCELHKDIGNKWEKLPSLYITNIENEEHLNNIGFMVKPFTFSELKKELHHKNCSHIATIKKELGNGYEYNISSAELLYNGEYIHLTRREKILIELMIKESNKIVSTDKILYSVWSDKVVSDKTIRTLIKQLNDKFNFNFIQNIYGQGYRIELKE